MPIRAKGFCSLHYYRNYKYGAPGSVDPIHYKTNRRVKQHPLFETWRAMRKRCYYEKHPEYKNYGGRGIKVCNRWQGKDGFENFLNDMGPRPNGEYPSGRPMYTLDRIDVDGDYCPENCRWATQKEQCLNTRQTVYITHNGETKPMREWIKILGIKNSTFYERRRRHPNNPELWFK